MSQHGDQPRKDWSWLWRWAIPSQRRAESNEEALQAHLSQIAEIGRREFARLKEELARLREYLYGNLSEEITLFWQYEDGWVSDMLIATIESPDHPGEYLAVVSMEQWPNSMTVGLGEHDYNPVWEKIRRFVPAANTALERIRARSRFPTRETPNTVWLIWHEAGGMYTQIDRSGTRTPPIPDQQHSQAAYALYKERKAAFDHQQEVARVDADLAKLDSQQHANAAAFNRSRQYLEKRRDELNK